MEKIIHIAEIINGDYEDVNGETVCAPDTGDGYDGYIDITTKQVVTIMISNDQCCCESAGYVSSVEDVK